MDRRSFLRLGAALPGVPAGIAATSALAAVDPRGWRRNEWFSFQKGLKGVHQGGRLADGLPLEHLSKALLDGSERSYHEINRLFERYAGRAIDPCGAMLAVPGAVARLAERMAPPPAEDSSLLAAELVELYWAAELRDLPFAMYERDPVCRQAAKELHELGLYASDSPEHLFGPRGGASVLAPFRARFLLDRTREWPRYQDQRYLSFPAGRDFVIDEQSWLYAQSGESPPARANALSDPSREASTGRRLGTLVYRDHPTQFFVSACLQLYEFGNRTWSRQRPFRHQDGSIPFVLGGLPHALACIAKCVDVAMRACWRAKWAYFMYPRPEEVAYWSTATTDVDVLANVRATLAHSAAGHRVRKRLGKSAGPLFLPQMYPEGAPAHPSYPGGHAVAAGAGITAIKFFLRADARLPGAGVEEDGYSSEATSVHEELNRLAWCVSFGRSFAGIHFRSDNEAGIRLGEAVALEVLREEKAGHPISYKCGITTFDGMYVEI